jgi:hypothetical protein
MDVLGAQMTRVNIVLAFETNIHSLFTLVLVSYISMCMVSTINKWYQVPTYQAGMTSSNTNLPHARSHFSGFVAIALMSIVV